MNSEDKNTFASFHPSGLGITLTFISLGLIISNFDSLLISVPMWIFVSILWSYGIFSAIKGKQNQCRYWVTFSKKMVRNYILKNE
jgi:hypothetical protein